MDRPVYKIDILRSWFYIRDLSFFQYRKRISTAYRDSLVPSNEDICVLSLHISRFITFSFSKRVSHRYAFFFLFLLLSLFFSRLFSCLFFFFLYFNQIHVKFATQPRLHSRTKDWSEQYWNYLFYSLYNTWNWLTKMISENWIYFVKED